MIGFITGLGSKVWGYVVAAGVLLAGVAAFWFKAKSEGKSEERAKQTEKIHEKVAKAEKVRRDQHTTPDKRLRRFDRNR